MTVLDMEGALDLGHIDLVARSIALIEPTRLVFTISDSLVRYEVKGDRPYIVQEVLIIWRIFDLSDGVDGTVIHETIVNDLYFIDELYEKGRASFSWIIVSEGVVYNKSAICEHTLKNNSQISTN